MELLMVGLLFLFGCLFLIIVYCWYSRNRLALWRTVLRHMPHVFVSYRTQDTKEQADRLMETLSQKHQIPSVFLDEESISGGENFKTRIGQEVSRTTIHLVLIGPKWESICTKGSQTARYLESDDWVKLEFDAAKANNARIVPVLVNRDSLPSLLNPPAWVEELFGLQSRRLRLTGTDYDNDTNELAGVAVEGLSDEPLLLAKIQGICQKDLQSIIPIFVLSAVFLATVCLMQWQSWQFQVARKHVEEELKSIQEQQNDDHDTFSNQLTELEQAGPVLPFELDEFVKSAQSMGNWQLPGLKSWVIVSVAKVGTRTGSDSNEACTFVPLDDSLIPRGAILLNIAEVPSTGGLQEGARVKLTAVITGVSGGFLTGKLVAWWPVDNE